MSCKLDVTEGQITHLTSWDTLPRIEYMFDIGPGGELSGRSRTPAVP
jgi:hypothetical protein